MTAFYFLALSLSLFAHASSSWSDPTSADGVALLALKRSVSLDPSGLLSGWDPAVGSHCEWRGVACDPSSGRVTGINLTGTLSSRIAGTLSDAIGNLTELRFLSLPYNAFSGEIPAAAVGSLGHLEVLNLRGNNFSKRIPDQISNLSFLSVLDLAYNSLSGPIPENLIGFSRLESVDLSFNQLSEGIRVSPSGSCEFLTHLKLSGNYLVDKIPPEIGKCSNLRTLLLDQNILEGRIPANIGRISRLQVLDVSRNSLTERIPGEVGNCRMLSVLVLTNPIDLASINGSSLASSTSVEFNAFDGAIPSEILLIPSLEVLWAPRANLAGHLPDYWNGSCNLRVLNLGQNYISGSIPEWLGRCRNFTFLDLSSNNLQGSVPLQLGVGCMVYINISRNSLSGSLSGFSETSCAENSIFDSWESPIAYSSTLLQDAQMGNPIRSLLDDNFVILHDFSWNNFGGPLPSFSLSFGKKFSYVLLLNNNGFDGPLSVEFFRSCEVVTSLAVNLSANQIPGEIGVVSSCHQLRILEAANNHLSGSIPLDIGNLNLLSRLDLRGNYFNGTIPDRLGGLKDMQQVLLGGNKLSGEIPIQLGGMTSLTILDFSKNSLSGSIPSSLANVANLEAVFLYRNRLSGEIPRSFSTLPRLTTLDVSYNNLSGDIPHLEHSSNCDFFRGNLYLHPCLGAGTTSSALLPSPTEPPSWVGRKAKLKSVTIAAVASASVIVSVLLVLVLVLVCGRGKFVRPKSLRKKVVVTFTDTPTELNHDNVVKATGNFSIQNLIGTGGFGSTYKAELVPGFLVAVKRLSMGRFQGLQQFDAEIRTLGRIRHKNLVTLIGYHMGEADTFLIYNYLSGGNLETFIHNMSSENVNWPVIHKIALDVAQALSYLHYSCAPRIVHRDIKPSNILLDEKLNAYLSDFGLARLLEVSETHATTDVAGTFGYVAPEYATTCRVSDKADVYSFGVVLLELLSGKRSLDPSFSEYGNGFTIVAWGRLLVQEERADELFPPALWEAGPKDNLVGVLRLALACTVEALTVRPSMKQVTGTLKQLKNQ